MSAASRGGGFTPAGLSLAAHRRWWGQQMTFKYTADIFFRHPAVTTHSRALLKGRTGITPGGL